MVYEVTVSNVTNTADSLVSTGTSTTGGGYWSNGVWISPYDGYYTSPTITYWQYPSTIYMYQITCPRCKKMNWMQLDVVTPCTKCKAQLKAVTKQADYEVPVNA